AASPGKLVRRALTRVLTPGTILEEDALEAKHNHYVVALNHTRRGLHAAWLDLSTGEFQLATHERAEELTPILEALNAREWVVPVGEPERWLSEATHPAWRSAWSALSRNKAISTQPAYAFEQRPGFEALCKHFGVHSLEGLGILEDNPAIGAAAALLAYATYTLCQAPRNIHTLKRYEPAQSLKVDPSTLRNLEVFRTTRGERAGALLSVLDETLTAPGGRLLERWLANPLTDLAELHRRQSAVGEALADPMAANTLRTQLGSIRDIPRVLARLRHNMRSPRDLGSVRDTLQNLPAITQALEALSAPQLMAVRQRIHTLEELSHFLSESLDDNLPTTALEGGFIRGGYDSQLDHLRNLTRDHQSWIADFERQQIEATGIKNLRIKYSGAFGYCIEVTKSNIASVPANYVRKQTMTNAERYTTAELKAKEHEILGAHSLSLQREAYLFDQILQEVLINAEPLESTAHALAELDVLLGWAQLARLRRYCCPQLDTTGTLEITAGRHPVVELFVERQAATLGQSQSFVPNDTQLDCSDTQIALITGPNMAGKSTYIRQVALIALMAQIGCWVPAQSCRIGLVDRIFSRIGASDELARGQSTFMVEMSEAANILHYATQRSLIILDEIGRGTSTYDGLSIAWAVIEHLHGTLGMGPRTLFATHYHELTQLAQALPRLKNFCVQVKEWEDQVIFTHL
ncbi:MAG: DNA mismatch repair protein MutS, partial [Verrucomicrobia bacterium 21-51-4]